MATIIKAHITGKTQNRTALGMAAAYIAMHPEANTAALKEKFTKALCPDAGIDQLLYTKREVDQKIEEGNEWFANGNAVFTKDGEWLTMGNGRKLAFNKVWTAKSLGLLQAELEKYNITGEVGTVEKSPAGYEICFEYATAEVAAKFQNRLALGMMAAFVALHPMVNAEDLNAQFDMKEICPDAGVSKLFFSESEVAQEIADGNEWFANGNAVFAKEDEWLVLGDGEKVALSKMWSASSLQRLKEALAVYGITGEAGVEVDKSAGAGYEISYEYREESILF